MKAKDEFYGISELEQPILIKRWVINWRFPFVHRMVEKYTLRSLQKKINAMLNKSLVAPTG